MRQTEQEAKRLNAEEWAKSLPLSDIKWILFENRHKHPEYAIRELIKEERRREVV